MILKFIFCFVLLICPFLFADNFPFITQTQQSFDPSSTLRVGVEVEIQGLSPLDLARIISQKWGGEIIDSSYERQVQGQKDSLVLFKYKVKSTPFGTLRIHTDDNSTSSILVVENRVTELVTKPLTYNHLIQLQDFLKELEQKGALGTEGKRPVSTQFTIDFYYDNPDQTVSRLIHFLKTYYHPDLSTQIKKFFSTAETRKTYVGQYSKGMMTRLLSPDYHPTAKQFYFDFMYRQILEINGFSETAWLMEESKVRELVINLSKREGVEAFLRAVKWNDLKISSLLIYLFPQDPLSQFLLESKWIKSYPAIEFREANTDFLIIDKYHFLAGLIQRSFAEVLLLEKYPHLKGNGLDPKAFDEAMKERPLSPETPWPVRIVTHRSTAPWSDLTLIDLLRVNRKKGASAVLLNPNNKPLSPVVLPGESVVYHSLPSYAEHIVGKYNPALINQILVAAIESKDFEAIFWQKFKPGAMPRTEKLADLIAANSSLDDMQNKLNQEFPNGWILKGVHDSATQKSLLTHKSPLREALVEYNQEFESFQRKKQKLAEKYKNLSPDLMMRNLMKLPGFSGWRIKRFLQKPETAIVQEFVAIKKEYRVEIVLGKILGEGSTVSRYNYKLPVEEQLPPDIKEIQQVEAFAQELLDSLPPKLKVTPFALDVAILENDRLVLIESNPGPNSGFLAEDHPGIKALNRALAEWPRRIKSGEVSAGLSLSEQSLLVQEIKSFQRPQTIGTDDRVGNKCTQLFRK